MLLPGTQCIIQILYSVLPCVIGVLYPCHSRCCHSWCQERNVPHSYSLLCFPLLLICLTTASVAPCIPGARNEMSHSNFIKPVALRYWCPLYLHLWLLSFPVPGAKCAIHLFSSVLPSVICMLDHYLRRIFDCSCQEPNVSFRSYIVCCPVLLVSCIPAPVAASIPGARNEMCQTHFPFCVALCYLYS